MPQLITQERVFTGEKCIQTKSFVTFQLNLRLRFNCTSPCKKSN